MKVVCINNKGNEDVFTLNKIYDNHYNYITISKIYDILEETKDGFRILNDDDCDICCYPKECFKLISEIRNDKIDKLLAE